MDSKSKNGSSSIHYTIILLMCLLLLHMDHLTLLLKGHLVHLNCSCWSWSFLFLSCLRILALGHSRASVYLLELHPTKRAPLLYVS